MSAIALDENNDRFIRGGDVAIVTGIDEVVQAINSKYLHFLGEWFLDLESGVPWFQSIFVTPVLRGSIESILKNVITSTPGVTSLIEFDADLNPADRIFRVTFEADTDFGPTGEVEVSA